MSTTLQIVGIIWIAGGILACLVSPGFGWVPLIPGLEFGVFPGIVVMALGKLIEQVDILVNKLAPEEEVPQPGQRPASPAVLDTPRSPGTWVRPPWEKDPNG